MKIWYFSFLLFFSGCAFSESPAHYEFKFESGIKLNFEEYLYTESDIKNCSMNHESCFLNGVPAIGVGASHPNSYVANLILTTQSKVYKLNTENMYNAALERPREIKGVIEYFYAGCFNADNCIVRGLFSDAGGSYVAEWLVIDGVPMRTILTSSGDVVHKFIEDIRPPVYE